MFRKMVSESYITGNTYCFNTENSLVPFYKLNRTDIVLMDSGLEIESQALTEYIRDKAYIPKAVLLSHAHTDHFGGLKALCREYDCTVYMDSFSFNVLGRPELMLANYPGHDRQYILDRCINTGKMNIEIIKGSVLNISDAVFMVLDLPGHSFSHIGFVTPDDVAYLADAVVSEEVFSIHPFLYHVSTYDAIKSLEIIKAMSHIAYIAAHKGIYNNISDLADRQIGNYLDICTSIAEMIRYMGPVTEDHIVVSLLDKYGIESSDMRSLYIASFCIRNLISYLLYNKQIRPVKEKNVIRYVSGPEELVL